MAIVQMTGRMKNKTTVAVVTQEPRDTRQIGADNSVINSMRAMTGRMKNHAAVEIIN